MSDRIQTAMFMGEDCCDSPIELIFYCAWYAFNKSNLGTVPGGGTHMMFLPKSPMDDEAILQFVGNPEHFDNWISQVNSRGCIDVLFPQASIDRYRVDFVWMRHDLSVAGKRTAGAIAIECDGKDFHDASVDQLKRDRKRDRVIQAKGFPIVRFTGAELYKSPIECVEQAEDVLQQAMKPVGVLSES